MKISLAFLVWSAVVFDITEATALASRKEPSNCGDWIPYKDEKCIKTAAKAGSQTQDDGEIVCEAFSEDLHRESYPRLITIKTKEEQDFLQKFLFVDNHVDDHVWLGLKEVGNTGEFLWNDGSKAYFTNWANQNISDDQHHCVQMESGGGTWEVGLWVKVKCTVYNTVVCERTQTMTLERLQNLFFSYKLEQKERDDEAERKSMEAERKLTEAEKTIAEMKQNPVPIGFIYTQLPDQPPPTTLWPNTNWTDISSKYAGLFFRVIGGKAAPFGQVQEGNTTRLEQVEYNSGQNFKSPITIPPDGSWSDYTYNGAGSGTPYQIRFRLSKEEVRPRNQAMKVWQRNK